jgi:hypothetical protein
MEVRYTSGDIGQAQVIAREIAARRLSRATRAGKAASSSYVPLMARGISEKATENHEKQRLCRFPPASVQNAPAHD